MQRLRSMRSHRADGAARITGRVVILTVVATLAGTGVVLAFTAGAWAGWPPAVFAASQNIACLIGAVVGAMLLPWRGIRDSPIGPWDEAASHDSLSADAPRSAQITISPFAAIICVAWGFIFAVVPTAATLVVNFLLYGAQHLGGINPLLWFLWILGTWAFISTLALAGNLLGTLVPGWMSMLAAGVFAYTIAWVPTVVSETGSTTPLTGYFDLAWFFYEPTILGALTRLGLWLGFLVVIPAIALRSLTWILVGGALICASTIGGLGEGSRLAPVSQAFSTQCIGQSPQVCTPLPFASSLETLDAYMRPGIDLLPDSQVPEVVATHRFVTPAVAGSGLIIDISDREALPSNIPSRLDVIAGLAHSHITAQCSSLEQAPMETLAAYLAFLDKASEGEFVLDAPSRAAAMYVPSDEAMRRALPRATELSGMSNSEFTSYLATNSARFKACNR